MSNYNSNETTSCLFCKGLCANELGYCQEGLQTKMEEIRIILDIAWLPTTTNLADSQRSSLIN